MKSFDVFFPGEDAHRIRPLIRFLELQEMEIRQHTSPKEDPSVPFLVIVSESYAGEPWLSSLLENEEAVAVLLGHGAPENAKRTADLSSWPARSADRALAGLAKWMKSPAGGLEFPGSANDARKKAAQRKSQRRQNIAGILVILAIFGLIAWLPSLTESTQGDGTDEQAAEISETPERSRAPKQSEAAAIQSHISLAATEEEDGSGTAHGTTFAYRVRTTRIHCQRRWSLSGHISQCWITPEQPFSPDPLYLSGPLRPSA